MKYVDSSWVSAIYETAHCIKSVHIRSYSGPYLPAFGLDTESYRVSFRIQSECRKIRTRITPNTDTFQTVVINAILYQFSLNISTMICEPPLLRIDIYWFYVLCVLFFNFFFFTSIPEEYSEPSKASNMKLSAKIVNGFQPLTIYEKKNLL